MKPFTVIVSFTAECCTRSHLWAETVEADTREAAIAAVTKSVREGALGGEPFDYCVIDDAVGVTVGEVLDVNRSGHRRRT